MEAAEPLLHEFTINLPSSHHQSFDDNLLLHHHDEDDDDYFPNSPQSPSLPSSSARKKTRRSRTAPAMKDLSSHHAADSNLHSNSSSVVRQAALLLVLYLSLGVVIYSFNRDHFTGAKTHPFVDALYFCIVMMCTIGYGDIAPTSPTAKILTCFFVLIGFGFIRILLSGVVNYVLDKQENMILAGIKGETPHNQPRFSARNFLVDVATGRMRIRFKVGLALWAVVLCIGAGILVLHFVEQFDMVDSLYLSVMSVTTVGYGEMTFKTVEGRLFASIWLLFSTLAVARAFMYLVEARIDKRQREIANWVLHRGITVGDLLAADINNNGFISKSEYVIFKLKEMGKIWDKDILQICAQFDKLDRNNSGKITLPNLLEANL